MTPSAALKDPVHVAFFLLDLAGGGTERVNLNLANELARRGHRVDLVLARKGGAFEGAVDARVRVVVLGCERAYRCLLPLRAYLVGERPDVLITVCATLNIVAIAASILSGARTRIVPAEHMPVGIDRRENPDRWLRAAYRLYPIFYRFVPAVVVNCDDSAADFAREFPMHAAKLRVIHNPVVDATMAARARVRPREGLLAGAGPGRPVLIAAGRLTRQKNFPLLLRAFARVRATRDCELVILGARGEAGGELTALAEELGIAGHVHFPGFADDPYAWFGHATLFVLSSIYETLPTVLIEALACGLPAVATRCFGVAEILDHGRAGTIVDDFEPATLAGAILAALDAPPPASRLLEQAGRFAVGYSADAYEALIAEVTGRGGVAGNRPVPDRAGP